MRKKMKEIFGASPELQAAAFFFTLPGFCFGTKYIARIGV
jgi:hypothetical protein